MRGRLDSGAVIVLSAMLEATQSAEKNGKEETGDQFFSYGSLMD